MSPRNACLGLSCLVALLLAVAAQAGEVSMDSRGYSAENEHLSGNSRMLADQPALAEADSSDVETRARNRPKWGNVTASSGQPMLTDDIDAETAKSAESAGGSSSSNVSVPAKPRNRWQSLVPGAIK